MRLIDADELITAFPCGESVRTESVRATINHMPTIEVSEESYLDRHRFGVHEEKYDDTPQTERMTEEEIDTMLAKALVGQTDCPWK